MNDERTGFALISHDLGGARPVLCSVKAEGRIDGLVHQLTLRQTYRNTTDRTLEVVYTFPLPALAVLTGFACELNGARQVGKIEARQAAELLYEQALADGDAPMMLELDLEGMYTANIGNLKPGDEAVLEVRYAELLAFEQGRIRLAIPTTIAPRYGKPQAAGLQAQQVPEASLRVEHPLELSITIASPLADGSVCCPTHRFSRLPVPEGLRLDIGPGAWLDRDVVILLEPHEPWPSLVMATRDPHSDTAPTVVLAAFQLPAAEARQSVALKLLVDCSGSMAGDNIDSARVALQGLLDGLTERDEVGLSRFGSTFEHLSFPAAATADTLTRLASMVTRLDADMGGTEMQSALQAVLGLPLQGDGNRGDVLLITDGNIWQAQELIDAARASGQRVFIIGVGSAPAQGMLRRLAEATGGACELVTPGEALQAAARRMLARLRQQTRRDVRVDWGCQPVWQTGLSTGIFDGDTVIALAGLKEAPSPAAALRLLASGGNGELIALARGEASAPCPGDVLPRIAAARRLDTADGIVAKNLAIDYRLMSGHTHCVLVHERTVDDKAAEQAELHRVRPMLAAGWGGTSLSRRPGDPVPTAYPMMDPRNLPGWPAHTEVRYCAFIDEDWPASDVPAKPATLGEIARGVRRGLTFFDDAAALVTWYAANALHDDARAALDTARTMGLGDDEAWVLLAFWVSVRHSVFDDPADAALLQSYVDKLDPALCRLAMQQFDQLLGTYGLDSWTDARRERLDQALARTEAP